MSELEDRREQVARTLRNRSPRLLAAYETAVELISADPVPGREALRILSVCHCMRELMLGLPTVMSDELIERPEPSSSTLLHKLPSLRVSHPELDLTVDQDLIPIPRAVAHHFDLLITTAALEDRRNRRNAAILLTGGSDDNHPVIQQWQKAYRFFVGWAHLDRNYEKERELPSDGDVAERIRVVEDVVIVRGTRFFDNLRAVEDILAAANAIDEGGAG